MPTDMPYSVVMENLRPLYSRRIQIRPSQTHLLKFTYPVYQVTMIIGDNFAILFEIYHGPPLQFSNLGLKPFPISKLAGQIKYLSFFKLTC